MVITGDVGGAWVNSLSYADDMHACHGVTWTHGNCCADILGGMSRICWTSWHCIQHKENSLYAGPTKAITGSVLNMRQARKWGALKRSFFTKGMSRLLIVEMIRILNNNSTDKIQCSICWSGSSHLHLRRQKSNCSSYFVNQFMDVIFFEIHTRTLLENLLSVIMTHSRDLLMSEDAPARVWHLRWTQQTISIWSFTNLLYSLMSRVTTSPNSIVTAIVNSGAYLQSPLMNKWESM